MPGNCEPKPMNMTAIERNLTHYEGRMSSEVRIQITELIIAVTSDSMGRRTNIKKLCSVAIELLDNAQRYCSSGFVMFNWRLANDQLMVHVENRANRDDAVRMLEAVTKVNAMDRTQVIDAFRAQLGNSEFGLKGGAGLGFLDIARKVEQPIMARIIPLSKEEYLCSNEVHIPAA
jgi:hypothetical protein